MGCNEGLVTLAVAARFGPRAATGVDIDHFLIHKACANLTRARAQVRGCETDLVHTKEKEGWYYLP